MLNSTRVVLGRHNHYAVVVRAPSRRRLLLRAWHTPVESNPSDQARNERHRSGASSSQTGIQQPAGSAVCSTASRPPLQVLGRGVRSVAELADAWALVSGKLPIAAAGRDGGGIADVELIIEALKLALSSLQAAEPGADGRALPTRAAALAGTLAELCAAGVPLDAESIAAGVVAEAAEMGVLDSRVIQKRLGSGVAALVHDVLRVRTAPQKVELYDDVAASSIREYCLAFTDVRACVVEVICRWDALQHGELLPLYEQQAMALEALQIYAPLGHALGLGPVSCVIEDTCFKILFPESYAYTATWLRTVLEPAEASLLQCQQRLLAALEQDSRFKQLADSCVMRARTKSLFSLMKKLLRLDHLAAGGRRRDQVHDLLGMRALVQPRRDLPPAEAEAAAARACYIVQDIASSLFEQVPGRSKDYIASPKPNGYQSLHMSLRLPVQRPHEETSSSSSSSSSGSSSHDNSSHHNGARPATNKPNECAGASSSAGTAPTSCGGRSQEPCGSRDAPGCLSPPPASHRASQVSHAPQLVPCVELQVRTVRMDSLAESGEAAHAAYKGGLNTLQVRQLQAWTRELQQRLAGRPQGRLQLPQPRARAARALLPYTPAVAGATVAAASGEAPMQRGGADGSTTPAAGSRGRTSTGASDASQFLDDGLDAAEALVAASASTNAAAALFKNIDRDGSGSLSITELQHLLEELGCPTSSRGSKGAEQATPLTRQDATSIFGSAYDCGSGAGGSGTISADFGAKELMALLDADDDGSVTFEEFLKFHNSVRLQG